MLIYTKKQRDFFKEEIQNKWKDSHMLLHANDEERSKLKGTILIFLNFKFRMKKDSLFKSDV